MGESKLIKKYVDEVNSYKYISFDLFDTLIFRTFKEPMDVFDAVEYIYNSTHKRRINNFRKERHSAELKARRNKTESEITINEIYEFVESKDREWLKQCEKNIEIENCIPNKVMCSFLKQLQDSGKQILITTDMYLDSDTINKILNKLNIEDYILFLSSEIGLTKVSGKLFPYIIDKLKIDRSEIVHFGDNPISDIKQAKAVGITSYERFIPDSLNATDCYLNCLNGIVSNHIQNFCKLTSKDNSVEHRIGYTVLGPIVAEFCKWVNDQQNEKKADRILFVAREGYLLEKAYLELYPEQQSKVGYIKLNKNLMRFPMLYINPTAEQFLDTLPMRDSYTVKELLTALYLDCNQIRNINNTSQIPEILNKKDILNGKYDDFFCELFEFLKDEFQYQYECFLDYIKLLNIPDNRIMLVNNSVNGNGQIMIERILRESGLTSDIYGLQFVRSRKCRKILRKRSKGWMTDSDLPLYRTMQFNRYALMLEHLMFESIGTALHFEKNALANPEIICKEQGLEDRNNKCIEKIQTFALEYISLYKKHVPIFMGCNIMKLFYQMFSKPICEDAKLIGGLYNVDENGEKILMDFINWKQGKITISANKRGYNIMLINKMEFLKDFFKAFLSYIKGFISN